MYQPWDHVEENYWLTVVEKKALEVKAKVLPAETLKAALWNTKMDSLQVFYDDRRSAALNIMYAPKDADAKAVLTKLGKDLEG